MKCLYHVHSENSLKNCAMFIDDILSKAQSLGYESIVLMDSGNMTGVAEFINKASSYNIKPIPGVEINVIDKDNNISKIAVFAKDYTGYVGLCKAVSEENRILIDDKPVISLETLSDIIGKNSDYESHIYFCTSGVDGYVSAPIHLNAYNKSMLAKSNERLLEIAEEQKKLKKYIDKKSNLNDEILELNKEKKKISVRTNKNFQKKEEHLSSIEDEEEKYKAKVQLEKEKEDCKLAEKELVNINAKIARRKKDIKELDANTRLYNKLEKEKAQIEKDNSEKYSVNYGFDYISKEVRTRFEQLIDSFGKDNVLIEFMFHGLEEEADLIPILSDLFEEYKVKSILSNDVYTLDRSDDEILKRQIIMSLKDNEWVPASEFSRQYYMKSEDDLVSSFIGFLDDDIIDDSLKTMDEISDHCSFSWPDKKHYPLYVAADGKTSEEELESKCRENIPKLFSKSAWTEEYESRFKQELAVIQETGYSDYTLILSEILAEGRKGKDKDRIGYYIGPGRGSGAGSLVNYLMRITNIDPIKYGLIFERYLNIERISPPDIDSDIATSTRDYLVNYIINKYSKDNEHVGVCTITTKQRLTAKAAVKAAGRVISARDYGNAAKLYVVADKISKAIPTEPKMTLSKCIDTLRELFTDDVETEIIDYALLIEGALSGYGTHAAGMIISDNGDVTEYAPVMNMGDTEHPVWNIQYDKEESEGIGMLKLDALGLTTLDIIGNTLNRIYKTKGIKIDIDNIKFEKEVFKEIYGRGDTVGVFQCESAGMKKMWMQLQPDRIDDIIAGVALYRPGPLDFIPDYIKGKHNPYSIKYLAPQLKPILEETYGQIVYQEQVMRIVRDLAGFSMGRSDLVRRAMSKKKDSIMNAERKNFIYGNEEEGITGCINNGISEEVANKIYDLMIDFAKYAFNKSHAAAYAILSYQSAWLKYHYPLEFLIEAMNQEKPDNIPMYIEDCKRHGFKVLGPDINKSIEGFNEIDGEIIYGFGNIKGVKKNASSIVESRNPIYKDLKDFLFRCKVNKSTVKALIESGAFDNFYPYRGSILHAYEYMTSLIQKINETQQKIEEAEKSLSSDSLSNAQSKRVTLKIANYKEKIESLYEELNKISFSEVYAETNSEKLKMEKDVLFTYISVHPLDDYEGSFYGFDDILSIDSIEKVKIAGVIEGLKVFTTKKTNRKMAVFYLQDKTSKIKVICFPNQFDKYCHLLEENNIIIIYGSSRLDDDNQMDYYITVDFIGVPHSKQRQLLIYVDSLNDWKENIEKDIAAQSTKSGSAVIVYNKEDGQIYKTAYFVNKDKVEMKENYEFLRTYIDIDSKREEEAV